MERDRIVDSALDLILQQRSPDRVAAIAADYEQVVTRLGPFGFGEESQAIRAQHLAVESCQSSALRVPLLEALELGPQHCRLKSIDPRVVPVRAVSVMR